MRLIAIIAWAIAFPGTWAAAQSTTPPVRTVHTPTSLPTPVAEPESGGNYEGPAPREKEGPSDAEIGPVQRHFVRASTTDDLAETVRPLKAAGALAQAMAERWESIQALASPSLYDEAMQLLARRGHYFTITWTNHGPRADYVARFEYRQVKSKEVVRTLTQNMPHVEGTTRSYFAVVDQAYLAYGPVSSWRFTILRGDTVVAESKSFVW